MDIIKNATQIDRMRADQDPVVFKRCAKHVKRFSRNRADGFTLIEVLIVVVILSVVASIAVPSYGKFMTNARRTDAMVFLSELAGEQQRYFSENNEYAANLKTLGYPNETMPTPDGHYTVSISNPGSTLRYVLTATPVSGGKQASDDDCKAFLISSTGAKSNTGSKSNCW
jgi:type IV pilus assembly protein PilE